MPEAPDISKELRAICDKLGLDYQSVAVINFLPSELTATWYIRENGHYRLDDDGNVTTVTHTWPVVT